MFWGMYMKMLGATSIPGQGTTPYASGADFCRIYAKDMPGLYLLSFLLTGQHSLAEKCFSHSLDDSQRGHSVFKEWAPSWARRTIIRSAIQMIRPRLTRNRTSDSRSDDSADHDMMQAAEIVKIVRLPRFERFVFVMSVLERYSPQECSLLLDCARRDVVAARTCALQQIALAAQHPGKVVSIDSDERVFPDSPGSVPQPQHETARCLRSELPGKVSPDDENRRA